MPRFLAWVRARAIREIASKLDPGVGARPTFWGRDPARGPTRAPNGADPYNAEDAGPVTGLLARTTATAEALRGWGRRSDGSVDGGVGTARLRLAVRVGVPVPVPVAVRARA